VPIALAFLPLSFHSEHIHDLKFSYINGTLPLSFYLEHIHDLKFEVLCTNTGILTPLVLFQTSSAPTPAFSPLSLYSEHIHNLKFLIPVNGHY
jgi:hypothetical protein